MGAIVRAHFTPKSTIVVRKREDNAFRGEDPRRTEKNGEEPRGVYNMKA